MWFGDGAASVLVGDTDVIAEFVGGYTVSYDFIDHYRGRPNVRLHVGRAVVRE